MNDFNILPCDIIDYPEDIASAFKSLLSDEDITEDTRQSIIDGLYYIRACAENECNHKYFRVLYAVLAKISEKLN